MSRAYRDFYVCDTTGSCLDTVEITQHGDVVQNLNQQVLIFNLFPQNPFVQAFVEIGLGSGQKTSQQNPDRGFMENSVAS